MQCTTFADMFNVCIKNKKVTKKDKNLNKCSTDSNSCWKAVSAVYDQSSTLPKITINLSINHLGISFFHFWNIYQYNSYCMTKHDTKMMLSWRQEMMPLSLTLCLSVKGIHTTYWHKQPFLSHFRIDSSNNQYISNALIPLYLASFWFNHYGWLGLICRRPKFVNSYTKSSK